MKQTIFLILVILLFGCGDIIDITNPNNSSVTKDIGTVQLEFKVPSFRSVPEEGIHRISLAYAYNMDSIYKELFFKRINVADNKELYISLLPPGDYAYVASVGCSCGGDTCLYGGFPGGQYGRKYDSGLFSIEAGKTTIVKTNFIY